MEPRSNRAERGTSEEYLPRIPPEVRDENVRFVVERLVAGFGGNPVDSLGGEDSHRG
ncbi:MAG: hypothetical protein ABJA74_16975 [Lapillicoccus sp.]